MTKYSFRNKHNSSHPNCHWTASD